MASRDWKSRLLDMQCWFAVDVEELAHAFGAPQSAILLANLDSDHALARAVRTAYYVSQALIKLYGGVGRNWLSSTGISVLRKCGATAFDREASRLLTGQYKSEDAVALDGYDCQDPDTLPATD